MVASLRGLIHGKRAAIVAELVLEDLVMESVVAFARYLVEGGAVVQVAALEVLASSKVDGHVQG
jgi:hypothetical protein